ncbi:N-acetylmuramoyl-L-alanine amidase [Desulfosporosinus youngiae]|uniref:Negative regulator of beta-lactamase expression n=1 Tax=Desulfosporosinus youngiae DSM 17734 TaxID=768710 RepID=H5Y2P4_9FIRM|nr:N-acetylmuramoyl-L-alanine amidase [Desulfosporosinus youngiae]EHQ88307.1 negative regulator of beta-lactamase expression [Desulfosporosinus youngiae DSM 17734]
MLKENDEARKEVNLDIWHKAGYDGEGINILLCDLNGTILPHMKEYCVSVDPEKKMVNEPKHNTYTAQVLHEALPKATIYVAPWTFSAKEIGEWLDANPGLIHLANVSLSSPVSSEYDVFKRHNIPVCCSSGNNSKRTKYGVSFPADLEWTIAVGAYNWADKGLYANDVVDYSNGGEALDAVSCTNIWVKTQEGNLLKYTGTSTSSPWGCGTLGAYLHWRLKNGLPTLGQSEAKTFIRENCIDIRTEGFDYDSGHGLFCLPKEIPKVEIPPKEVPMSTPYNRNIQALVIHHMGDGLPPERSILQRWNPYSYDYPEYDYGIEADGTIRTGRPLSIQGSHAISNKTPYNQRGYQWWNRNAIGVGLAGDFTLYPMPAAQFRALVTLVKRLMAEHGLTLDNVYPHGQVTYTDCPGCTYSKVPALTKGLWSYDEFEQAVLIEEEDDVLDVAVLLFTKEDYWAGVDVAARHNCAVFVRPAGNTVPPDAWHAKQLIVIGGPTTGHANEVLLSGNDKYDTAAAVAKYLG